jgi:hypothetical protein
MNRPNNKIQSIYAHYIMYHVVLGILLVVGKQLVVEDKVAHVEEGPPDLPPPVPYHPPLAPCRRRRRSLGQLSAQLCTSSSLYSFKLDDSASYSSSHAAAVSCIPGCQPVNKKIKHSSLCELKKQKFERQDPAINFRSHESPQQIRFAANCAWSTDATTHVEHRYAGCKAKLFKISSH